MRLQAPPEQKTLQLVQVMRAVAALMVVVHHTSGVVNERFHNASLEFPQGAAGVDIFFVISGLVMMLSSRSLLEDPSPAKAFMVRRIERIVPLYWIATTLKIALLVAGPALAVHSVGSVWHVVASYLFLPSFHLASPYPVLIPGWTLNYEMFFYVLFAIALGLRWPPLRLLVPILGVLCTASLLSHDGAVILFTQDDAMVLEFLYGVVLAQAMMSGKIAERRSSLLLCGLGFAAILLIQPTHVLPRVFLWGLPALAIVVGAVGLERWLGRLVPRWLLEIGDASYAIYLFHTLLLPVTGFALVKAGLHGVTAICAMFFAGVVGSTLVGIAVHRLIERPMMRYFKQRRQQAVLAGA